MIALRGSIHVACFHHSCLLKGVWRHLTTDVVIGDTPLFFSAQVERCSRSRAERKRMEGKKRSEVPETSMTHNGVLRLVVDKAFHTHTSGIASCRHWRRNNGGFAYCTIDDSGDLFPDQKLIGDYFLNDLMGEKPPKCIGTAFANCVTVRKGEVRCQLAAGKCALSISSPCNKLGGKRKGGIHEIHQMVLQLVLGSDSAGNGEEQVNISCRCVPTSVNKQQNKRRQKCHTLNLRSSRRARRRRAMQPVAP